MLGQTHGFQIPGWALPDCFHNDGHHVISLAHLCRWLAEKAETLGVEIYPGFAGTEILYGDDDSVKGVATGDAGRLRDGSPGPQYQPGVELYAKYTLFAEGCRRQLGKQFEEKFRLRRGKGPQIYGIGLKELWEIAPGRHQPGLVIHTCGWPMDSKTYGGGFLYHMEGYLVSVGLVVGLGYANPRLSGRLAAEACYAAVTSGHRHDELAAYPDAFRESWLYDELHKARNFKPWMSKGLYPGGLMFGIDQILFRGKAPWTLRHHGADHEKLKEAKDCRPIIYPAPDGVASFGLPSSVYLSKLSHEENQPDHLLLKDDSVPIEVNLALYDAPEQRYCPAGVYEIVCDAAGNDPRLQINASNCLHCKTCDIKDPTQNITWTAPQGGDGPNYPNM